MSTAQSTAVEKVPRILNLAFYRFAELPQPLTQLRQEFKDRAAELQMRGTVLLTLEGMNAFVAGEEPQARAFLAWVRERLGWPDLESKESWTDKRPFKRMLVKLKRETISLGMDEVQPAVKTGPRLEPEELKKWLDEGRPVTLIDTRNDYEYKLGAFEGAWDPDIKSFREFPRKLKELIEAKPEIQEQPVVMFCTGGIRCEKATVVGMNLGLTNVYQLEGGILKYFEKVGGSHWRGDCFVFDQRVTLKPDLTPGDAAICFACRTPLSTQEIQSPDYVYEKSCPYCIGSKANGLLN